MSHSERFVGQVLVYHCERDLARWMTMSEFTRMQAVNPQLELIDEIAPNYEAVCALAGPKPQIPLPATEDYGGGNSSD